MIFYLPLSACFLQQAEWQNSFGVNFLDFSTIRFPDSAHNAISRKRIAIFALDTKVLAGRAD
jgi:hypothetical protein